jgi:hypothetical protein
MRVPGKRGSLRTRCRKKSSSVGSDMLYFGESRENSPKPYKFIGFGDFHGPQPYNFVGFGDFHGPQPYNFIGFGDSHGPQPYKFIRFGDIHGPKPYKFRPVAEARPKWWGASCRMGPFWTQQSTIPDLTVLDALENKPLGAMDVTKPYKFIKFGAMDGTTPYRNIRFWAMDVTKPYNFTGFGAMDVT